VGEERVHFNNSNENSEDEAGIRRSIWWNRLQLRTAQGYLQTADEEFRSIKQYYQDLYDGPAPAPDFLSSSLDFQLEEVLYAIKSLSPGKAMPSYSAPAVLWNHLGCELAPQVLHQLNQVFAAGPLILPKAWCISELVLLPKPGKALTSPSHLRPIALLPPIAKVLASALAVRIQTSAASYLENIPQFAYLKGRSLQQALERVISHCASVRALVNQQVANPHTRRAGREVLRLAGGLQLSLDVTQAYDGVSREHLYAALSEAQIPDNLITAILAIHNQASLRISHDQYSGDIRLLTGLRQGCSLSPILWSIFTGWLLRRLDETGLVSVCEAGTMFADDAHFSWLIKSGSQLEQAYNGVRAVLNHLAAHKLKVSLDKTVILVELRGPKAAGLLKKYVITKPSGPHMRFNVQGQHMDIKIVSKHVYLGACISYRRFEHDTVQRRLTLAKAQFARLKSILKCQAFAKRLHLSDPLDHMAQLQWRHILRAHLAEVQQPAPTAAGPSARLVPVDSVIHEIFECTTCGQQFSTAAALKRHEYQMHMNEAAQASLCPSLVIMAGPAPRNHLEESTDELKLIESLIPEGSQGLPSRLPDQHPRRMETDDPLAETEQPEHDKDHPAKWRRPDNKGQGGRGKGHSHPQAETYDNSWSDRWGQPWGGGQQQWKDHNRSDSQLRELQGLRNRVDLLTSLVLRHDNQLNILALDQTYMIFTRTDIPGNVASVLYEAGKAWNNLKASSPEKLEAPMRVILFQKLLVTIARRLDQIMSSEDKMKQAKTLHWITADGLSLNSMKWDPERNQHVLNQELPTLEIEKAKAILEEMLILSKHPLSINRFHATRTMTETYTSPTLTFKLDLGLRTKEAGQMWTYMNSLAHSALWVAAGTYARHNRLQRDPLAQRVAQAQKPFQRRGGKSRDS
ncbi:unnamed protein product, partial [Symbiodinium microadriaticum]